MMRFEPGSRHTVRIKGPIDPSSLPHKLRHDAAKSAFWLLLYHVLNASAADGPTAAMPQGLGARHWLRWRWR